MFISSKRFLLFVKKRKANKNVLFGLWIGSLVLVVLILYLSDVPRDLVGKATGNVACQKGDVNIDGFVDDIDLELMIGFGLEKKIPEYFCCADINSDSVVNEMDYDAFFNAFLESTTMGMCS